MTLIRQQVRGSRIFKALLLISGISWNACVVTGQTHPEAVVTFLERPYHLGSFHKKSSPMWEFVTRGETVANWTTLVTIIDRPDAHTRQEMDRLAEGVMSNYKSHDGKVLLAKTLMDSSGIPYNYMVVAFDEPGKHSLELNFVKVGLASKNAYTIIYAVRIKDSLDYAGKAKAFLDQRSSQVGKEIGSLRLPDIGALPVKEF